jgi:hypothetical protein
MSSTVQQAHQVLRSSALCTPLIDVHVENAKQAHQVLRSSAWCTRECTLLEVHTNECCRVISLPHWDTAAHVDDSVAYTSCAQNQHNSRRSCTSWRAHILSATAQPPCHQLLPTSVTIVSRDLSCQPLQYHCAPLTQHVSKRATTLSSVIMAGACNVSNTSHSLCAAGQQSQSHLVNSCCLRP